jgi:hypothetical protein
VTSTGKRWTRRSLVNTLTSARIAGLREHDGHEIEGSWKGIVDRETRDALRAALAPSKSRRAAPRSYYLSGGLLVCGHCKASMKGRSWTAPDGRPRRRAQYACSGAMDHNGCGGTAVTAEPLEDRIASLVIARLSSSAFRARPEASATDPRVDDLYRHSASSTPQPTSLHRPSALESLIAEHTRSHPPAIDPQSGSPTQGTPGESGDAPWKDHPGG